MLLKTKKCMFLTGMTVLFALMSMIFCVFAWYSTSNQRPLARFEVGQVIASTDFFGNTLVNQIQLVDLMYVDFMSDLVNDETNSLNGVATSVFLKISAEENSLPIRNEIELAYPDNQPDLLVLIIIEGLNVTDSANLTSDYHAYLSTFMATCGSSEEECREALTAHNLAALATIEQTILNPTDTLTIQLVFWGDYYRLPDRSQYLDIAYELSISGAIVQSKKE